MGKSAKAYGFLVLAVMIIHLQGCSLPKIIIVDDPLSPEEHINLGLAYEKNGEFDLAEKEYRAASEDLPLAYVYLGNLYFETQRLDGAEAFYRKAIKADPSSADALNNLAWLYYTKRENLDEAERLSMKALELGGPKRDVYLDTLNRIREIKDKAN